MDISAEESQFKITEISVEKTINKYAEETANNPVDKTISISVKIIME